MFIRLVKLSSLEYLVVVVLRRCRLWAAIIFKVRSLLSPFRLLTPFVRLLINQFQKQLKIFSRMAWKLSQSLNSSWSRWNEFLNCCSLPHLIVHEINQEQVNFWWSKFFIRFINYLIKNASSTHKLLMTHSQQKQLFQFFTWAHLDINITNLRILVPNRSYLPAFISNGEKSPREKKEICIRTQKKTCLSVA
jgi:hypothetical protein